MTKKRSSRQKSGKFNRIAREIIRDGLNAVDPIILIRDQIRYEPDTLTVKGTTFDLSVYRHIHLIGAGKASYNQYKGIKRLLGKRLFGGVIVSPDTCSPSGRRVRCMNGNHPVPGPDSYQAGKAVIDYINSRVSPEDLVLALISGGASSLLAYPGAEIKKNDKSKLIRALINSPANISEINCVRKHLSSLKGGRMAELIHPAKVISLILSDIIDSPLEDIGSGLTVGDTTTFSQALDIIRKYRLNNDLTPALNQYFIKGKAGHIPETPSPESKKLAGNHHVVMGDMGTFLMAARESAEKHGIETRVLTSGDQGEARETARKYASIMKEALALKHRVKPPVILLAGGELTVSLKGPGKGGRNQEFVLQMLHELRRFERPFFALSMGTDGIDGPTDAAGAWIDHNTMKKVRKHQLDIKTYLDNNDSYSFFKQINQLLITGPTGTNVMDFRMFYIS
jgi:glycerate 2-kinase